jgi:cell shape-determining protein MreC
MFRNQLESHEQAIKNLRADLDHSQQEVKNTLRENAELREALKTARSRFSRPVSAMVSTETVIPSLLHIICNLL